MRMFNRLGLGAAASVMLAATALGSASADQPPPSGGAPITGVSPAVASDGEVCVDVLSKQTDSDGNSLILASVCSKSLDDAQSRAIQQAREAKARAGETKLTLIETTLADIYRDYNDNYNQLRRLVGYDGTCDGAGYTMSAWVNDIPKASHAKGFGKCNAMRLRNKGTYAAVTTGYYWMPVNFPLPFNDDTDQYHPYCYPGGGISSC